tara:strand:- start:633 stop:1001 length:369 start_codon:yes stop_codon:yes gene_type:complete
MNLSNLVSECPFGLQALEDGLVKGPIIGNSKTIVHEIKKWNDEFEVIIINPSFYWLNYYDWCIENEKLFATYDLIAIPNEKRKYILLQRLSKLNKVSKKLQETNYYKDYTKEQWQHIERREK